MISTDFAPNESWDDAWLSLKLLLQPWRWKYGRETEMVKEKIKKLLNVTSYKLHVSCFLSGRSALYFLLKSLNLPSGSEVIVQAFTCEAVVLPILALGLKPVYIDIESDTFSMDYRKLINRLTDNSRVLILQHTFGLTPKFRNEILKLAQERKLIIIEDLAHGFSNNLTMKKSNNYYALLSFGRSKLLSSVFGGAILSFSNSTPLLPTRSGFEGQAIQQVNNLSFPSYWFIFRCLLYKPLTMFIKSTYDYFYLGKIVHKILDVLGLLIPEITPKEKMGNYDELFNKAYPNALAILLLHQLNKFERTRQQRSKICQLYSRVILSNSEGSLANARFSNKLRDSSVTPQNDMYDLIRFPLFVENRDKLLEKAKKRSIYLGKWYDHPVSPKDLGLSRVEYRLGSCPKAEEICQKIINLPTNISVNEAGKVVEILNDVI